METNVVAEADRKLNRPAMFVAALLMVFLSAIALAVSPITDDFADIKAAIFLVAGPLLMVAALALIAAGRAAPPSKGVAIGLTAYLAALLLSVLNARYRWAGWNELFRVWSGAGFFMAALCIGSERRTSELLVRCFVVMILTINVIGFLMFSFPGFPPQHSVLSYLFKMWHLRVVGYGQYSHLWVTLYMLSQIDQYMMSTFLGGDHYAFFCLLYFPFALLMALDPGPVRHPLFWRGVGLAATAACAATVFFCQYFSLFLVWVVFLLLFGAVFYFVGDIPGSGRRDWLLVVMLAVLVLLTPNLSVSHFRWGRPSFDSLRIFWAGALGIFRDYPLLGGGPGSLLILYPSYRNPDYHLYQISSVTPSTRNSFLDLLTETGLLGLAAFLLLLGALLVPAIRWVFRHPDVRTRSILLAATIGVLALLAGSLFYPGSRLATGASSLWMGMGFLGGLAIQARRAARLPLAGAAEETSANRSSIVERSVAAAFPRWIAYAALLLALMILPSAVAHSYHFFRGRVCAERGMVKMQLLDRAIPQDSAAREKMVRDLHQAAEDFEAAIAWDPTLLAVHYRLGAVWTRLAQIGEDPMKTRSVAGPAPDAEEAQVIQCLEQARSAYEKLAKLAPDYSNIHPNLAALYRLSYVNRMRRAGQSPPGTQLKEEAERYAQLALDQMERMSRLSTDISVAEFVRETAGDLGQYGTAITALKAASDLYPKDRDLAEKYLKAATDAGDTSAVLRAKQRIDRLPTAPPPSDGTTTQPKRNP